ncbi:MAG: threonylcarbamoyl-AMP synthase [Lachnospiraceae bacterium]|nr:threonylcarbamoyl-AMP synthase [Lachnospiraceae bacterium]
MDSEHMTSEDFREPAAILHAGGLVAFPTETVYGLGGNALDPYASQKIYAAKGRPSDNPLIVHIADIGALDELAADVPAVALKLAEKFWPGPLTMIFKKKPIVPDSTTGGLSTVAIRFPSHPVANRLILESGLYIAAPSANASGRPSTTKAEHVIEDLDGKIDMIIDSGTSQIGLESTIIDLSEDVPTILRPGFVTIEMLKDIIPDVVYDRAVTKRERDDTIVAKAPGMKYRHYAPKGDLTIFEGDPAKVAEAINEAVNRARAEGRKAGVLATAQNLDRYDCSCLECVGSRSDEEEISAHLFDTLRKFDELGVELIFSESFDSGGLGQAIMNRLLKAAGYRVKEV